MREVGKTNNLDEGGLRYGWLTVVYRFFSRDNLDERGLRYVWHSELFVPGTTLTREVYLMGG